MWYVERWKILKCRSQKKIILCRVSAFDTRQRASLPSVAFVHSAKSWRRQIGLTAGQNLPSVRRWHLAWLNTWQRPALPRVVSLSSVRVWALGKDILCRVPDIKYSAKFLALGKACDSGSECCICFQFRLHRCILYDETKKNSPHAYVSKNLLFSRNLYVNMS